MTIQQAIINLYETDYQIRESLKALSDYAVEKPFGLSSLQTDEDEITKAKQNIMNGYPTLSSYFYDVLLGTLNEWEQCFVEWLDHTEFSLCKDNHGYYIEDLQGVNLGDINQDRFDNAQQIFDRMEIYIDDYLFDSLSNCADELNIDTYDVHNLADWLSYRGAMPESKWDFNVVDMICNHSKDIDLSKVITFLSAR